MKKIKFLSILCLFLAISINLTAQTFSGGNGTEKDPYLISSKADMEALASSVNSGSRYSDRYFLLTQDITDEITTIIGDSQSKSFGGIFDGGGYCVDVNIKINPSSTASTYAGVFGHISSATIKNLGLSGSITHMSSGVYLSYFGGICGYATHSTISNCYNAASISAFHHAGGICGYAYNSTIISNCYNRGDISSLSSLGSSSSGGICGYAYNSTVSNCYNRGNISSSSPNSSSNSGGICGAIAISQINNCYNTGNISSLSNSTSSSNDSRAGGICGGGGSKVKRCISTNVSITAKRRENISTNIGRICGLFDSVEMCYASSTMLVNGATVSSSSTSDKNGKDEDFGILIVADNETICVNTLKTIVLNIENPIRWERSSNNGSSWQNIDCTNFFYIETDVLADGKYIYRALNSDYSYSEQKTVYYKDLSSVNTFPNANTKNATENITFTLDLTAGDYNYQWYKDETIINGANSNSLTLSNLKPSDSGNYYCVISDECNIVNSSPASLTVNKLTQAIIFNNIPTKTYGDETFAMSVQTNSGLPVIFSSSDPSKLFISGEQAFILGTGTFVITAQQAGNDYYLPASSSTMITVNKAPLTITADNKQRFYGENNPPLTMSYSGLKNNENEGALDQLPSIYCIADRNSLPGNYDIVLTGGMDKNYQYQLVNGKLTIETHKLSQSIQFDAIPTKTYGDADFVLLEKTNVGLPITYHSSNPNVTSISGNKLRILNAGTTNIIASQTGNEEYYAAADVNQTLIVNKANLIVTADDKVRSFRENNPQFTMSYSGFVNNENELILDQLPQVQCDADINSPIGQYPIRLTGGLGKNYSIICQNGTLTVVAPTNIDNIETNNIIAYPNPVVDYLFIQSDYPVEKVEIYNHSGACVLISNNVSEKLDVSGLASGLYFVRIYVEGVPVTKKIVVRK